jgi:hypothetical protein
VRTSGTIEAVLSTFCNFELWITPGNTCPDESSKVVGMETDVSLEGEGLAGPGSVRALLLRAATSRG